MRKTLMAAAVVTGGLLVGAACSGDEDWPKANMEEAAKEDAGVSQGVGSQDASADVKLVSFTGPDAIGMYTGQLEVTNHSSKTSDYYIEVNIESADGTVVGWSNALVQKLQPNAKAVTEFQSADDGAAKAVVTEVQRTAS